MPPGERPWRHNNRYVVLGQPSEYFIVVMQYSAAFFAPLGSAAIFKLHIGAAAPGALVFGRRIVRFAAGDPRGLRVGELVALLLGELEHVLGGTAAV